MSESQDYRKFIESSIHNLHESLTLQIDGVKKQLDSIEKQTTKTNGSVKDLQEKVKELEIKEITHITSCPQNNKFTHMEQSILELKQDVDDKFKDISFFVRNPKLGLFIIVGAVLITLFAYFEIRNVGPASHQQVSIEATK